jgi:hypothetical protein
MTFLIPSAGMKEKNVTEIRHCHIADRKQYFIKIHRLFNIMHRKKEN